MSIALSGKAVLIVEDQMLNALAVQDMVSNLGCRVAGLAVNLNQALDLAENGAFDLALLDINLNGESSYPVARALVARRIPFLFTTGMGDPGPSWSRDYLRIMKPFSETALERMMVAALAAAPTSAPYRLETAACISH